MGAGVTSQELLSFIIAICSPESEANPDKAEIRDGERFLMVLFEQLDTVLLKIRCIPGLVYMNKFFSSRVVGVLSPETEIVLIQWPN